MAQPEVNYTHINENWRQRLQKESHAAKVHHDLYDYLIWKAVPASRQGANISATVKYFSRGDWTVAQKRIGLHDSDEQFQGEVLKESGKHALTAAHEAHEIVLSKNRTLSCQHRTASQTTYGARGIGLEMFGVGKHGRLATRTKEPVGNGSKLYFV